jgi:hypothetical protein
MEPEVGETKRSYPIADQEEEVEDVWVADMGVKVQGSEEEIM